MRSASPRTFEGRALPEPKSPQVWSVAASLLRLRLAPFGFRYDLQRRQLLPGQARVQRRQAPAGQAGELADYVVQFAAQRVRAHYLLIRRPSLVSVDVAVEIAHILAQPLFAGDHPAFFGSYNLGADLVHIAGQLLQLLPQ